MRIFRRDRVRAPDSTRRVKATQERRHRATLAERYGLFVRTIILSTVALTSCGARGSECPGNPDAIGTSRVLSIDPAEYPRVGTMQYPATLPLDDHEVVLTFDDGPLRPHTGRVLSALRSECVKATFFIIGRMGDQNPALVQEAFRDGHSIGTHTQNHPLNIRRLPKGQAEEEIEVGIASVTRALVGAGAPSPFFRFPGLGRTPALEHFVLSKGLMVWSADVPADDWTRISANEVRKRALERLEKNGRGILLLHDMQARTARALPMLLRDLKQRGFRIVHVVAAPTAAIGDTPPKPKP